VKTYSLYATCAKGMSDLLKLELATWVSTPIAEMSGGVAFEGSLQLAYQTCFYSRVANRVLVKLGGGSFTTADEYYQRIKEILWSEHFSLEDSFLIELKGQSLVFKNTLFAVQKAKDAVVDQFREVCGQRPSVSKEDASVQIYLYLQENEVQVFLDLAGGSLHQRGYRAAQGPAPLKENLAAAILYRAGWPALASQGYGLLDPMCGSGTLLIEGALMALGIAPGWKRLQPGSPAWKGQDLALWQKLFDEVQDHRTEQLGQAQLKILGADQHPQSVANAKQSVRNAGLEKCIDIVQRDFRDLEWTDKPAQGLVVANPPYGERLGEIKELEPLYGDFGRWLKANFIDWNVALFTANESLGSFTGLRAWKKNKLFNGAIPCVLLHYRIAQKGAISEGVRTPKLHLSEHAEMFANRIIKNQRNLKKWLRQENIECYRLYDADMPEYAVAVDVYGDWVHVQEYQAPAEIDEKKAQARLQDVVAQLPGLLNIPKEHLVLKVRKRQKGVSQYEKQCETQDGQSHFFWVQESGLKIRVNLLDYLDTGLFLDHRLTRQKVRSLAAGKDVLNLFCYTAVVSLYAAAGGARSILSMDMSNTYLDWAVENFAANELRKKAYTFLQEDCVDWLANQKPKPTYDLIFLDPPTFSNSKRMEDSFDVHRDHGALIQHCMNILRPDGLLIFSTNFRKFRLDAALQEQYDFRDITKSTIPKDFERNAKIHQCFEIRTLV